MQTDTSSLLCCLLQWSKRCCAQNGSSHTTDCNVIHTKEGVTTHCNAIQLLGCGGRGWRDGSAFKMTYCSGRMQKTWIHCLAPTGHLTTTSNSISKVPSVPFLPWWSHACTWYTYRYAHMHTQIKHILF